MSGSDLWLIAGLGNPGRKYERTRHNIGFMVIDELVKRFPVGTEKSRFQSVMMEIQLQPGKLVLAKPQTFMNLSGQAVSQIARWYKIPIDQILIVYDDLDLPLGQVRLRSRGSAGGHNGIHSVMNDLGSEQVPRLRVGIDRPAQGSTVSYVLSRFRQHEEPLLPEVISGAADAAQAWMDDGITEAMNRFNGIQLATGDTVDQSTSGNQDDTPENTRSKGSIGDYIRRITDRLHGS